MALFTFTLELLFFAFALLRFLFCAFALFTLTVLFLLVDVEPWLTAPELDWLNAWPPLAYESLFRSLLIRVVGGRINAAAATGAPALRAVWAMPLPEAVPSGMIESV